MVEEQNVEEQAQAKDPNMKWYVVHCYTGQEAKAQQSLRERMTAHQKIDHLGEILIPTENVVEMVDGQKRTSTRKFFPGYILVEMNLTDEVWHIVKNTPKITGFIGGTGKRPAAVPEQEVRRLTKQISDGTLRPKMKTTFDKGESVRVIEGPFQNFNGIVDEVKPDKGKLRVLVSIFGRSTPVELDFIQVEKN